MLGGMAVPYQKTYEPKPRERELETDSRRDHKARAARAYTVIGGVVSGAGGGV